MIPDPWSQIFDVLLGALVFLGSFLPRRPPEGDEPDEALPALGKKRLILLFRFAGLALFFLALVRLLKS
ncbi:hypothetical protein DSOUD_1753 [Desulfuromonas soudanensis]|uniref:Transmembrane protein n=1 Tax=Desulfuromonas soudanensis TaxID=1603606 RepID=A0A0M5IRA4_9BACT|nr:hypothetical protein [Desulfuromonas soudanensis]ALC16531.1 hypothetical protein DSOUD_1753 [Desulfuromonas soudanensis]